LVHWDISYNNILLLDSEDDPESLRQGLLIDFEYAASRSKSRALAPGSRTVCILFSRHFNSYLSVLQGTAPFMSVELLTKQEKIRHDCYHNLESLFFVLIYLCTNLSGPGTIRTREELEVFTSIPLSSWFKTSSSRRQIGINKAGALCNFRTNILNFFAPYFEDLKPCAIKLFKAMYHKKPGNPAHISHDTMIGIFTRTLESLPEEKTTSHNFQPLLVDSPSRLRKRSLGIHDNDLGMKKKLKSVSLDAVGSSAGGSGASKSNWAIVPGNDAAFSGSSRGRRKSKSCGLRSAQSSQPGAS
jgi:hypothetical protein